MRKIKPRPTGCLSNEAVRQIQNRALDKARRFLRRKGFEAADFYNLDLREKEKANNVR